MSRVMRGAGIGESDLENWYRNKVDDETIRCILPRDAMEQFDKLRSLCISLSHGASAFVYNTMGMTQRVARVCLRQLRLVVTLLDVDCNVRS